MRISRVAEKFLGIAFFTTLLLLSNILFPNTCQAHPLDEGNLHIRYEIQPGSNNAPFERIELIRKEESHWLVISHTDQQKHVTEKDTAQISKEEFDFVIELIKARLIDYMATPSKKTLANYGHRHFSVITEVNDQFRAFIDMKWNQPLADEQPMIELRLHLSHLIKTHFKKSKLQYF